MDEFGCDRSVRREHGWSAKGTPCPDVKSGQRKQRVNGVAAWSSGTGDTGDTSGLIAPFSFNQSCNHELFELWFWKLLCPELRAGQVVILDNARFHRPQALKRLARKVGCRVLFLPPYSPDLNKIEPQWRGVKSRVRAYRRQGMELHQAVELAMM